MGPVLLSKRIVKWTGPTPTPPLKGRGFQKRSYQMPTPEMPQKAPYPVEVEAGKSYWWCACGKSASQPFCDGSHKGSEFTPLQYKAEAGKTVYFCGCKQSKNGALCDATHQSL